MPLKRRRFDDTPMSRQQAIDAIKGQIERAATERYELVKRTNELDMRVNWLMIQLSAVETMPPNLEYFARVMLAHTGGKG